MASLFLDFSCAVSGAAKVTQLAWCTIEPVCAVVTNDNRISFYLEEGVCLEDCKVQRKCDATVIAWHPKSKVLATGWEDGHVSVWSIASSPSASSLSEASASCNFASDKKHGRTPVRVAIWSPSTARLVTCDSSGTIIVWKADSRGGLSDFREYNAGSGVTCAVYSTNLDSMTRNDPLGHTISSHVSFFGTRSGAIYMADDLGHSAEVASLGACIDHLLFYESKNRLVVLTSTLSLVQLQIGSDGKVIPVMKVKVSVVGGAADRGIRGVCWAGPGVMAAATGESLVRFWNLANDETYVISLTSVLYKAAELVSNGALEPFQYREIPETDVVLRANAVGTHDGKIGMWRFVGNYQCLSPTETSDVTTSAADWQSMPYATACGGVDSIDILDWGPGQGILAAASPDGATSILSETVLHRLLRDDVGAIQLSTDTVRIERQNGTSTVLTTDISIRGLAVSSKHIVAWNGQEARVFEWSEASGNNSPSLVSKFTTTARAIALRDETLVRTSTNLVELCNLQGVRKLKISFSDGEGSPTHVDVNGNFLAVATDTGLIKVFQVDRREPKQLGTPGRFPLERNQSHNLATLSGFGSSDRAIAVDRHSGKSQAVRKNGTTSASGRAIRSIKCNADGTRVSILADHVHGTTVRIQEPDSCLYVYDSDRDIVDSHDFGSVRRYPVSHYWDPAEPKLLACETLALRMGPETKSARRPNLAGGTGLDKINYKSLGLSERLSEEDQSPKHPQREKTASHIEADKKGGADGAAENRSKLLQKKLVRSAEEEPLIEVTTLFVTADHGMLLQDVFTLEPPLEALLGVQVPRLFFTRTGAVGQQDQSRALSGSESKSGGVRPSTEKAKDTAANVYADVGLCSRVMRDFVGLDDSDEQTRNALLNFSYYLTVGNMDEAHRAVRLIKSPSVWENMAHMCVKTKRLDVAEVCLGHMGHARGAAAVRIAKKSAPEREARVAAVAIQLGLRNDAARLYRECGRFDLLNELYQAAGEWYLALDTAERYDRIHLRSTHHRYALHLESLGQYDAAARHFELADTHRREVPRMLVEREEQAALERYVMRSDDAELLKWWAGYCESLCHFDSAQTCYTKANDFYNLVRVACFENDIERAADLVDDSRSAAAAYSLARHLEGRGDINEAIQYFARSGCYNHAIRLARQYGLDTDLMQFCLKARPSLQVDCASYFERKGEYEKAVQLYQKGGELEKALDLCFKVGGTGRSQMFEVLANIAKELDDNASPAVLARCAEFFIEHEQFEDAARMFIRGGRYMQAINLCVDRNVQITEDLAEALTPEKAAPITNSCEAEEKGEEKDAAKHDRSTSMATSTIKKNLRVLTVEERTEILIEVAKALKKQGSFQLACKKYTQAGDRSRAMKCLFKLGDTKTIVYYASKTRHRDIYILAANYLQSLDWQSGTTAANELSKKIVEFYTKAKAFEQLAAFYDAYAQAEIDEYRDYEKAVGALRESREQLAKAKMPDRDRRVAALDKRISAVSDFVEARRCEKSDPQKMVDMCTGLLQRRDVESAIRIGDVYALLVEHHYKSNNAQEAYALIQQMREKKIVLTPYLEQDLLKKVHHAVGEDPPREVRAQRAEDEDPVTEEVPEEMDGHESDGDSVRHK